LQLLEKRVAHIVERLDRLNLYQLLEVHPRATTAEIKSNYDHLTRAFRHITARSECPDPFRQNLLSLTRHLVRGWRVLSDPEQRRAYDQQLEAQQTFVKEPTNCSAELEGSTIRDFPELRHVPADLPLEPEGLEPTTTPDQRFWRTTAKLPVTVLDDDEEEEDTAVDGPLFLSDEENE